MFQLDQPRKPINHRLANVCRHAFLHKDQSIRTEVDGHSVLAVFVGNLSLHDYTVEITVDGVAKRFSAANGKWYLQ